MILIYKDIDNLKEKMKENASQELIDQE